jgi:polyferredoxin
LGGLVFGTLLGPEATGLLGGVVAYGLRVLVAGLFVSGFLAAPITWLRSAFGGRVCGVCGLGLLFENYIVDASIFYKKQFPRI